MRRPAWTEQAGCLPDLRLATERGPSSIEANSLAELRRERAQDKQVFAFRLGNFMVIGPMPSAADEMGVHAGERGDQACEGITYRRQVA